MADDWSGGVEVPRPDHWVSTSIQQTAEVRYKISVLLADGGGVHLCTTLEVELFTSPHSLVAGTQAYGPSTWEINIDYEPRKRQESWPATHQSLPQSLEVETTEKYGRGARKMLFKFSLQIYTYHVFKSYLL